MNADESHPLETKDRLSQTGTPRDADDGQLVGNTQTRTVNGTMAAGWPVTTYHLRSTVLGGRVISEYGGQGNWITTMVYAGAERIGSLGGSEQNQILNTFRYADPVTGDEVTTMKNNTFSSFSNLMPTQSIRRMRGW